MYPHSICRQQSKQSIWHCNSMFIQPPHSVTFMNVIVHGLQNILTWSTSYIIYTHEGVTVLCTIECRINVAYTHRPYIYCSIIYIWHKLYTLTYIYINYFRIPSSPNIHSESATLMCWFKHESTHWIEEFNHKHMARP